MTGMDTYYRGLASPKVSEYFKIYMSLWVLAYNYRNRLEINPPALEYLKVHDGPLWQHALAKYAVGDMTIESLEKRAKTRGERAEFYFYTALLGQDLAKRETKELLEEVLKTKMVLYFEYEMAQHLLGDF